MRSPHVLPPCRLGEAKTAEVTPQSQVRIAGLAWSGGAGRHTLRPCCGCSEGPLPRAEPSSIPSPEKGAAAPPSPHTQAPADAGALEKPGPEKTAALSCPACPDP